MHLSERFLTQPWHIHPACVVPMAQRLALSPAKSAGPQALSIADFIHQRRAMEITPDGVAIIDVVGGLGRNLVNVEKILGDTDYNDVMTEVETAVENPGVKCILLTIDSGGGSVVGCAEARQVIAEATQEKPVIAYTQGMMCSAAYELAAGSSFIMASPTAIVGSIGTITMLMDVTAFWESMGVKFHVIPASQSDLKSTYWPQAELSEDQRAEVQRFVNRWNDDFLSFVRLHRMDVDEDSMRGQAFDAREAKDRGLIDETGNFDEAIDECLALAGVDTELES